MMNLQNQTVSHNRCWPDAAVTILIACVCPLALVEGVSDTWKKILRKTVAFLRHALSTMLLMAQKTTPCWKTWISTAQWESTAEEYSCEHKAAQKCLISCRHSYYMGPRVNNLCLHKSRSLKELII